MREESLIDFVSGLFADVLSYPPPPPNDVGEVCLVGPQEAGKTTIRAYLRRAQYYSLTECNDVYEYEDEIAKKTVCLFVFDVNKFMLSETYRQETWDIADFVYRICNRLSKKLFTIGTHFDEINPSQNKDKIMDYVYNVSCNKPFKDMFKKIQCADAREWIHVEWIK